MRERTTWDRKAIARQASMGKKADPYTMNQQRSQPSADKYTIGGPSDFAEDVAPSDWHAEYSGDSTARNEIGQPEFNPSTFKSASEIEAEAIKKASLCVQVAKHLCRGASESLIERQATHLMQVSDVVLASMYKDLVAEEQEEKAQGEQKQAQQDQQGQAQGEQKQAQQDQAQGEQKQAQQDQQGQGEQKQAQQDQQAQGEQKQAQQDQQAQGEQKQAQQDQQGQAQGEQKQAQQDQGEQSQVKQAQDMFAQQMQQFAQQMQQMMAQQMQQFAQQMQQGGQQQVPVAQQEPVACGDAPVMADDFDLDSALSGDDDLGIQMDVSPMDQQVFTANDEVLRDLFAGQDEEEQAQGEQAQQKQANTRTASYGTRPKGVSKLGGGVATSTASSESKLSDLWQSAPDVSGIFSRR